MTDHERRVIVKGSEAAQEYKPDARREATQLHTAPTKTPVPKGSQRYPAAH